MGDHKEFQLPGYGIKCGHCGSLLPRVSRTIIDFGFVRRERTCPQCFKLNVTSERVINTRDRRKKFNEPCEE